MEQNQEKRGYLVLSSKELVDQLSNADLQCDTALQPTKKDKKIIVKTRISKLNFVITIFPTIA